MSTLPRARGRALRLWLLALAAGLAASLPAFAAEPVLVGFDAEVGDKTSTSDEAVRAGIEIAIDEINAAGGVLKGRPIQLVVRDNRSLPARGVDNARAFASTPGLVAFFAGKFSPVALEQVPVVTREKLVMLDPWAAADAIVDNGQHPNYVFRIGLRDSWAMAAAVRFAKSRGYRRLGVFVPNTAWGRSNMRALERLDAADDSIRVVAIQWHNWGGETSFVDRYRALVEAGAQAVVTVANEPEGALLIREMAELPRAERLPLISHWGILGGNLPHLAGRAIHEVDLSIVQTFNFALRRDDLGRAVEVKALARLGVTDSGHLYSQVGIANAYDLMHLLARAIELAGSTDRDAVRDALECIGSHRGLIRNYAPPFSRERHEGLSESDLIFVRIDRDGKVEPVR